MHSLLVGEPNCSQQYFITLVEIKSHKTLLVAEPNCRQGPQSEKSILFQAIINPTPQKPYKEKKQKNDLLCVLQKIRTKGHQYDGLRSSSSPHYLFELNKSIYLPEPANSYMFLYVFFGIIYVPIFKVISIMYIDISEAQGK